MAVTIERKTHPERGVYYECGLDSGDSVQVHIVREPGYPPVNWFNGGISWYKTAGVTVTGSNGPPEDMALDKDGNGVTGKSWQPHAQSTARQAVEDEPITGLRFKGTAAGQTLVVWTGAPLREGMITEVGGV